MTRLEARAIALREIISFVDQIGAVPLLFSENPMAVTLIHDQAKSIVQHLRIERSMLLDALDILEKSQDYQNYLERG